MNEYYYSHPDSSCIWESNNPDEASTAVEKITKDYYDTLYDMGWTEQEVKVEPVMNKVEKWQDASKRLKDTKVEEADLRRELASETIGDTAMKNGRVTVSKSLAGYPVKAVQELGYSLDLSVLASIWDSLTPADKEAIKLKPNLQTGKYKKLPTDSLLHEAVITKMAMPTFTVGELVI